jgi:aminoglycoside phosphotransferase (APT) family kinase protein
MLKLLYMENYDFQSSFQKDTLQAYVSRSLGKALRLVSAEQFAVSTRSAPWHIVAASDSGTSDFVLRLGKNIGQREVSVMQALAHIPEIPTPCVFGWEPDGRTFGVPCFLCDFIDGESLLRPLLEGEEWAADLYLRAALQLNAITREQLSRLGCSLPASISAMEELEDAYQFFQSHPSVLVDEVYEQLVKQIPYFHEACFSNGDLWLDNLLVKDKQLVGVIDFEQAGFSDPVHEFLLPFFNEPRLRGRGIEERYCVALGLDPTCLRWYHGLEYYHALHYVEKSGEAFNQYSSDRLRTELELWLATDRG